MRLRAARKVAATICALAAIACGRPDPPPVTVRTPSLEPEDVALLRDVVDGYLRRPWAARPHQPGEIEPHFLVQDTTLAVCPKDAVVLGPVARACLDARWLGYVSQVLPPATARTGRLVFEARNARVQPIQGSLGEAATFVPASVTGFVADADLLRPYPPGSAIVAFSAPAYSGTEVAVLAYRLGMNSNGALRLERQTNGRWSVVTETGLTQIE